MRRVQISLTEWSVLDPSSEGPGQALEGLELSHHSAAKKTADRLARAGVVRMTELRRGLRIEALSYVGRIVVGPVEITILPKIGWTQWHALFGYALRLRDLVPTESTNLETSVRSLEDLLVLQLLAEARDLIGHGLHREYVRQRHNLVNPKGQIDIAAIAKRGGLTEATLPSRFSRRSDDTALNRLLLSGLKFGTRLVHSDELRNSTNRLVQVLKPTVASAPLTRELLRLGAHALDRRTQRYRPALRLIELLHAGRSATLYGGENEPVKIPGFALDMNRLWQRLLSRVLNEWGEGLTVQDEFSLRDLFSLDPLFSPRRKSLTSPRPDFAVLKPGGPARLLDAKYRDLWRASLPREMLYQLALYAAAQGSGVVAMLYPSMHREAAEERIRIHDVESGDVRWAVALRPVSLGRLEELITAATTLQIVRERQAFASSLIGV